MLEYLFCGFLGLVLGWVFFPEPAWFRNVWAKTGWVRPTALYSVMLAMFIIVTMTLVAGAAPRTIRVIDGDTIDPSNLRASVRILGMDAPEIHKNVKSGYKCPAELALGLKAKTRLEELLAPPRKVVVKRTKGFDEYGRRLAIVTSDGVPVADTLIGEGLAKSWDGRAPRPSFCP